MVFAVRCEPVPSNHFGDLCLGSEKPAPFEKGGVSEVLESCSAFDVSLVVEVVMD